MIGWFYEHVNVVIFMRQIGCTACMYSGRTQPSGMKGGGGGGGGGSNLFNR